MWIEVRNLEWSEKSDIIAVIQFGDYLSFVKLYAFILNK